MTSGFSSSEEDVWGVLEQSLVPRRLEGTAILRRPQPTPLVACSGVQYTWSWISVLLQVQPLRQASVPCAVGGWTKEAKACVVRALHVPNALPASCPPCTSARHTRRFTQACRRSTVDTAADWKVVACLRLLKKPVFHCCISQRPIGRRTITSVL